MRSVGYQTEGARRNQPRDPHRTRRLAQIGTLCALGFALVFVGCFPTMRFLGYLPKLGPPKVTTYWRVVSIAKDRRSAVVKIDVCAQHVDSVRVTRVGEDVRLTVIERAEHVAQPGLVDCAPFSMMPTRVVKFGFALPAAGRVLDSGCPAYKCGDLRQTVASAP
jgi:hypothetical protein